MQTTTATNISSNRTDDYVKAPRPPSVMEKLLYFFKTQRYRVDIPDVDVAESTQVAYSLVNKIIRQGRKDGWISDPDVTGTYTVYPDKIPPLRSFKTRVDTLHEVADAMNNYFAENDYVTSLSAKKLSEHLGVDYDNLRELLRPAVEDGMVVKARLSVDGYTFRVDPNNDFNAGIEE